MSYYNERRSRRLNTHARNELLRLVIHYVGVLTGLCIVALFILFILVNWISGCGERFPTADGGYIQGECISPLDLFNDQPLED